MSAGSYEFKEELRSGVPKYGAFLMSASPLVAAQFTHSGYDWLLIDAQHSPVDYLQMANMIHAIRTGPARIMVRVASTQDRPGIQQALDLGADGVLIPYVNNAQELKEAVSYCQYPMRGTRSVGFPVTGMNKMGMMPYINQAHKNVIVAFQVETAACIENIDEIMAVPGIDMAFLGPYDQCMSMQLFEKYEFPDMFNSPELAAAEAKLIETAQRHNIILGVFLTGTSKVAAYLRKGFTFITVGADLEHALVETSNRVKSLKTISREEGKPWDGHPSNIV